MKLPLILLALPLAAQFSPLSLLSLETPPPTARAAYGPSDLHFAELRVPPGAGPHHVVALVHGGCWADRLPGLDPRATSLDLLRPLAVALAQSGIASYNIEYRRAGNPGGGFPGTYQDLTQALDHLRTLAPKHNLDLRRLVLAGHSSGGQLALWLAARTSLKPTHAFNIDGPPTLTAAQPVERNYCPIPAVTNFLGGAPDAHPDRYREGSVESFLPIAARQTLVVGGLLRKAPALYQPYAKQSGAAVLELPGDSHFEMLAPASEPGKTLLQALRRAAGHNE